MGVNEEELRAAFGLFDADNDGEVTVEEMQAIFQKLDADKKMDLSQIQSLMKSTDMDSNGTINFQVSQ